MTVKWALGTYIQMKAKDEKEEAKEYIWGGLLSEVILIG